MMGSFRRDFAVGDELKTVDHDDRLKLGRLVLDLLHRHHVIVAKFDTTIDRHRVAVGVESFDNSKEFLPLEKILATA